MSGELSHLDIFSGIGGFTLAAQWAGFHTIGFAEIEPFCCKVLNQHWPHIKNYGSVDDTESFAELRGRVCVLSAGVPCQAASLAGKRRGEKDDRWKWPTALDVVGSVQPAWCIFENPPGILSLDEFAGVLLRLGALGYEVRAFSVPANAVGAKHRRQRVFIVANCHGNKFQRDGNRRILGRAKGETPEESARWIDQIRGNAASLGDCGEALADADTARPQRRDEWKRTNGYSWPSGQSVFEFRLTESGICGVAHGLSSWMDGTPMPNPLTQGKVKDRAARLKSLGNSVVPQCAYPFFAAIAEVERIKGK